MKVEENVRKMGSIVRNRTKSQCKIDEAYLFDSCGYLSDLFIQF